MLQTIHFELIKSCEEVILNGSLSGIYVKYFTWELFFILLNFEYYFEFEQLKKFKI